ncbi:MAG TPA: hypothetical protein VM597_10335 [Gemmataceae bacterium]|nr:hypothetical protein [Gemmataceae bacterium]
MRRCSPFVAILLVSAAPPAPPDDLIRRGNAAVEVGQLDEGDHLYALAEERTADPGLVAFNKAVVSFKRGDFRRAELGFRRALGDGDIPADRRTRGLYNLGTSLVRQAGETDVKQLQAAIECYELVLAETADEGLRSDAGHNLELAKLLWAKARSRRPPGERDPDWEEPRDPRQPPPDPAKNPDDPSNDGNGDAKQPDPGARLDVGKGKDKGMMPKETEKKAPGHGNLPVVPDKDQVENYAPDDARARLQQATVRIRKQRQKLREEAGQGERPRANDW